MIQNNQRKIGTILSYVSIVITTIIQLLYIPFLIRKMGQSEYGLYSLVNSVIGYLTIFDFGFGNAIIVYTAKYRAQKKYDEEKKLHGMFQIIYIIIGVFVGLLSFVLYFNVDRLFGATMTSEELSKSKIMMLILGFNLFLTFTFNIYQSIINAYEKFVFRKIITIIHTILKPVIMMPLLFLGFKSITLVVVITILNIVVLLSNYIYCKTVLKIKVKYYGFDKGVFKTILGYSIWIFIAQIVDKANWSIDQFVLGAVSGTIAVSIYSVASTLNTLFINLSTAVSGVFLPKMSQLVAQNELNKINDEFVKIGRIQYYIIFLMCSGLVLFGKRFILWWAGDGFEESYYVALFLIIPVCFPLIQNLGISIMQAMNKFKFKAISTFIMAIANVFMSIYLAKKYGAIGSAIGTAISLVICNVIIMNIYYYKVIKINVIRFWKTIIKMTIPNIIPVSIILVAMYFTNIAGIKGFIVYGSIYTLLYCAVQYFINFNDYEKSLVFDILRKMKLVKVND